MRRLGVALATAWLLGWTLACGGEGATEDIAAAPLTDPWKEMDLPIGEGRVASADLTHITVAYPDTPPGDLGRQYADALVRAGWTERFTSSKDTIFAATYIQGGETVSIAVGRAVGLTTVTLS